MYHVSAQGIDERMINVHYYYYYLKSLVVLFVEVNTVLKAWEEWM